MVFALFLFGILVVALIGGELLFTPLLNKHLFSWIWCEEEKPMIKREVQERL